MNYIKADLNEAMQDASSYYEFKSNLEALGAEVPYNVKKFPHRMIGWIRKLRYECKQSDFTGKHMTSAEKRNRDFYNRLERLGHRDPLMVMNKFFG